MQENVKSWKDSYFQSQFQNQRQVMAEVESCSAQVYNLK